MTDRRDEDLASAETERIAFGPVAGEKAEAPVDLRPPDLAQMEGQDRYEPGPVLGRGGMGTVRLDRDRRIGRSVARKLLDDATNVESIRRFLREARIQGQLEHPAIPPLYDVGRAPDGEAFFTMKRLRGETLGEILRGLARGDERMKEKYPRRRLLTALLTVCDALAYAHSRGILHRDLKPANVMLGDYGEVWVLDWGIARILDEPALAAEEGREPPSRPFTLGADMSHGRLTQPGHVVGTLHYISPEQLKDEVLDGRTDVYALGMMIFEILVLKPFRGEGDYLRILEQMTEGKAARPSKIDPSIEPELDRIVERATDPDREKRWANVRELRAALDSFLAGERDADARAESARRIVKAARRQLDDTRGAAGPGAAVSIARADAMHEALRALAIDPKSREADAFVAELIENVAGEPPPAALVEIEKAAQRIRQDGMITARAGLLAWLLPVPLVVEAGVRSWTAFFVAIALLFLGIGLASVRIATGRSGRFDGVIMSSLVGAILVIVSGYLGPFVVVPTCATAAAAMFAFHAGKTERLAIAAILGTAVFLPFALEHYGVVPPGFSFEPEGLVLHPLLVEIPPITTTVGMLWVSLSFTVGTVLIIGRMRDRLDAAERRLHLGAWHLRQLFPATGRVSSPS